MKGGQDSPTICQVGIGEKNYYKKGGEKNGKEDHLHTSRQNGTLKQKKCRRSIAKKKKKQRGQPIIKERHLEKGGKGSQVQFSYRKGGGAEERGETSIEKREACLKKKPFTRRKLPALQGERKKKGGGLLSEGKTERLGTRGGSPQAPRGGFLIAKRA